MAKFASTLLGLTLVTACSASQADAGLFDWFGTTPAYHTTQVARPYTTNYGSTYGTNGYSSQCGPNGCAPCPNGQCGTVSPSVSYGYQAPANNCRPTTSSYYPSTSYPSTTTSYYGSSSSVPCSTGSYNYLTTPYSRPNNSGVVPYNSGVNSNPYYGGY